MIYDNRIRNGIKRSRHLSVCLVIWNEEQEWRLVPVVLLAENNPKPLSFCSRISSLLPKFRGRPKWHRTKGEELNPGIAMCSSFLLNPFDLKTYRFCIFKVFVITILSLQGLLANTSRLVRNYSWWWRNSCSFGFPFVTGRNFNFVEVFIASTGYFAINLKPCFSSKFLDPSFFSSYRVWITRVLEFVLYEFVCFVWLWLSCPPNSTVGCWQDQNWTCEWGLLFFISAISLKISCMEVPTLDTNSTRWLVCVHR